MIENDSSLSAGVIQKSVNGGWTGLRQRDTAGRHGPQQVATDRSNRESDNVAEPGNSMQTPQRQHSGNCGFLFLFLALTLTASAAEITIQKEWPAIIYTNQMIDRSVITNALIITNTVYVLATPASTNMGSRRPFIVTCPNPVCYEANQRLFPIKTKLGTSKRFLHATMHTLELTFVCPKCGKQFKTVSEKLIQDPVEEPSDGIRTNMPPPVPVVVPKIRAPKS